MPLPAEWEAIVNSIQDPALRESRRRELTAWHDGNLRQEDYNKKLNEQAQIHAKNLDWYNRNKGHYENLVKDHDAKEREAAALKAKVAELEAASAAYRTARESTPNDLEAENPALAKALQEARAKAEAADQRATKAEQAVLGINKMIEEGKIVSQDQVNQMIARGGDAYGTAMFNIWDLQAEHIAEFGKPIDRAALLNLAATPEYNGDIKRAYKDHTETMRMEKIREETRKDERAKADAEWNDKLKKQNLPYASGLPEPQLGPLQQRLQAQAAGGNGGTGPSKIPDNIKAGDPRLDFLIAQELKAEGKV